MGKTIPFDFNVGRRQKKSFEVKMNKILGVRKKTLMRKMKCFKSKNFEANLKRFSQKLKHLEAKKTKKVERQKRSTFKYKFEDYLLLFLTMHLYVPP